MSIIIQLVKSCYSPRDIARFRFQGIGKTILYVFLLSLISIIPAALPFGTSMVYLQKGLEDLDTSAIPTFKISDGQLDLLHKKNNVTVATESFTFIFDDREHVDINESFAIAFLKNDMKLISNQHVISYDYHMLEGMTNEDIVSFIPSFQSLLPIFLPILFVLMFILTSGLKFIEVTILSTIAIPLKNLQKLRLQFRHLWVISAYSVTLSTLFFTIMEFFQVQVTLGPFINWLVSIIIVYLVLKEIPRPKTT
ncbi:DUF1189 domain-containing protein [Bacillus timonensis]|nr:DUF1189 domain-containing protein [Bacillus timonensis]